jgi:peptide/nickel transport system permease protein
VRRLLREIARDRWARVSGSTLAALVALALAADLIASDHPLAVRVEGRTYWLPCLFEPTDLRTDTQATLASRAEWQWRTPVPWGPNQTLARTGELHASPPPWPPSRAHWLGTDELGRDVLARLVHGARPTLVIALLTVLVSLGVGVLVGGLSGAFGGLVDGALSRLTELMTAFPTTFFLLGLTSVFRTQSLWLLALALGLTRWTDIARLMRSQVLVLREQDFVLAARAFGAGTWYVFTRHLLPNAMAPVIVNATFGVGAAIVLETTLTFLGLGVPVPTASWGGLLAEAQRNLVQPGAWWLALFPGVVIAATVLAANGLGEALRRTLDGER